MPGRKRIALPEAHREVAVAGLKLSRQAAERVAEVAAAQMEDFHIAIALAVEQGFTIRDLAAELGVSNQVISKWRIAGEKAMANRGAD